jgi:hypothetical protein
MNFKTQKIRRITIKSPSIPLFQRGKLISPPFGKGFGMLTILSLSKEGGREGFSKR